MISLRGFCITTLVVAVWAFDDVRASNTWTSPVVIYYKPDYPYDIILVNIILKNVPAEADRYVLYYQTDDCDRSPIDGQHSAPCDVPGPSDTIPTNRTITIYQKLNKKSVRIYIKLQKKNSKLCAMKFVMDGIMDNNTNETQFNRNCFNNLGNECDIIADFENRCEDQTRAKIYFSLHQYHLTCEVVDEDLPEDTVNRWWQKYSDGSVIGTIPPVKGKKTEFKITFYKFDKYTYISSVMHSTHWVKDLLTETFKVPLPENGYKNYDIEHIIMTKYKAYQEYTFNCPDNEHSRIGVIQPTGYKMTTYDRTTIYWTRTKEDNGSIICCLNYHTYTNGVKTVVERTVTNITILIYEEPVNQDNVKGPTESPVPNNTTNDESPVPGTKTGDESLAPNNKTKENSSVTAGLLIGLTVVMGVAATGGCVVILYMKKATFLRCVKATPQEPPQTYIPRNPFYVNLLFREQCQAEIYAAEHIYEEID